VDRNHDPGADLDSRPLPPDCRAAQYSSGRLAIVSIAELRRARASSSGPHDERYVPLAWKQKGWSMWQFTNNGSCPGIPGRCDLNVVRDRATLAKLRLPSQR